MALVTCPECKGQISDQAVSCPHCGKPAAAKRKSWAEVKQEVNHKFWREGLITGVVGAQPSGWLWGVVPFIVMAFVAGALETPSTIAAWIFPAAAATYFLRCAPYWLKKRELRQLDDRELQRLFAEAKGIDIKALSDEHSDQS